MAKGNAMLIGMTLMGAVGCNEPACATGLENNGLGVTPQGSPINYGDVVQDQKTLNNRCEETSNKVLVCITIDSRENCTYPAGDDFNMACPKSDILIGKCDQPMGDLFVAPKKTECFVGAAAESYESTLGTFIGFNPKDARLYSSPSYTESGRICSSVTALE